MKLGLVMAGWMVGAGLVSAGAQTRTFVAAGATPEEVKFDLGGAAAGGPSVDAKGNVTFTLTQLSAKTGSLETWTWADGKVAKDREVAGGAIGTARDAKGRLLVGEWVGARVTAEDGQGHTVVVADSVGGRKFSGLNALAVDGQGGVYVTESGEGTSAAEAEVASGVDYIAPGGGGARQVAKLAGARKLILSPDGGTLIVSGAGNKVWKYTVGSGGALGEAVAFCTTQCGNPIAFDAGGNVYMAGDKLSVYSAGGEALAAVALPHRFSNGVFAGEDRKTLFLSGHDGVYTLRMAVKGAPTALDQASGEQ